MPRFKKHVAGDDGWSKWDTPVMKSYRIGCCDCGLVHDMDFRVLQVTKVNADGSWDAKPLSIKKYRVEFRARRNERSTGQMRRHMKHK